MLDCGALGVGKLLEFKFYRVFSALGYAVEHAVRRRIFRDESGFDQIQKHYFKVKIANENILKADTVVSTMGTKDGNMVKIVIEGDLP